MGVTQLDTSTGSISKKPSRSLTHIEAACEAVSNVYLSQAEESFGLPFLKDLGLGFKAPYMKGTDVQISQETGDFM